MDGQFKGTWSTDNDADWATFYVASQTQLTITLQTNACYNDLTFLDDHGNYLNSASFSKSGPKTITYTTPVGTRQFFLAAFVDEPTFGKACIGPYSVTISPASALVGGPPMPQTTVPTGEPNETADQAAGPLLGETIYTATQDTENDVDWFAFWANSSFLLRTTSGSLTSGSVTLYDANRDFIDSTYSRVNEYLDITYTPADWGMFYVRVDSDYLGTQTRFALSPSSSIQTGPKPLPVAGAIPWITFRKSKKKVVVYWGAAPNATSYNVSYTRKGMTAQMRSTTAAWTTFPRKWARRGLTVTALGVAPGGGGPSAAVKVKVRR